MCNPTETPQGYDVKLLREKLDTWLKYNPNIKVEHCIQWETSDCYNRATIHIPTTWNILTSEVKFGEQGLYNEVKLMLNKPSFKSKILWMKVAAKFAGAITSKFTGFHYVLLVDFGIDSRGKTFCVVYDPDVSATQKSSCTWDNCTKGADLQNAFAKRKVFEDMILGNDDDLGPLVRYYYCN